MLKVIKEATLLVTLLNGKVLMVEKFKDGSYKITIEGIDTEEINFSKSKKLWDCLKHLIK